MVPMRNLPKFYFPVSGAAVLPLWNIIFNQNCEMLVWEKFAIKGTEICCSLFL